LNDEAMRAGAGMQKAAARAGRMSHRCDQLIHHNGKPGAGSILQDSPNRRGARRDFAPMSGQRPSRGAPAQAANGSIRNRKSALARLN